MTCSRGILQLLRARAEATGNGARGVSGHGRNQGSTLPLWPVGLTASPGLLTFTPQVQTLRAQTTCARSSCVLPERLPCCPGPSTGERSRKHPESMQTTQAAPVLGDRSKAGARPAGREGGEDTPWKGVVWPGDMKHLSEGTWLGVKLGLHHEEPQSLAPWGCLWR